MTDNWKPIESAPKDETPVHVYGYRVQGPQAARYKYWFLTVGSRENEWSDRYLDLLHPECDCVRGKYVEVATHWMPLPEPPK